MAITTFSRILEFKEKLEDWIQYSERMGHFFTANNIGDVNKKRAILLTVIGPKVYKLFWSLIAPERLKEKSYADLVEAMKKHHNPKLSEIVQQYDVFSQFRQQGESISTFTCMSKLRALAEFCNFGTSLDIMLHDRLVCGVNDTHSILSTFGTRPNLWKPQWK